MAKASTTERAESKSRGGAKQPTGPLAQARAALSRGDVRAARALLASLDASASEAEREEARALADGLGTDPQALLAALAVFVVIVLAATFALFLRHG